jgi:hypothetical protein
VGLGFGAPRAWSAAGGTALAEAFSEVRCVESHDGNFYLCRAGGEVASGEKAVSSCGARARGACCISPVGFCYCSAEPQCTFAEDRMAERCDTTIEVSPSARWALDP